MTELVELTLSEWLEELVIDGSESGSIAALRIQMEIDLHGNALAIQEAREAAIVLCSDGTFSQAKQGFVFFQAPGKAATKYATVHSGLVADEQIRDYLQSRCGITEDGDDVELFALLASWAETPTDDQWNEFWGIVATSKLDFEYISNTMKEVRPNQAFFIKNCEGSYVIASDLLTEGAVLKQGGTDDRWIVDPNFASNHRKILDALNVSDVPSLTGGEHSWNDTYQEFVIEHLTQLGVSKLIAKREVKSSPSVPSHLDVLQLGSDDAKGRFTTSVLSASGGLKKWKTPVGYEVDSPSSFIIKNFGLIESTKGPRVPASVMLPSASRFAKVAPVSLLSAELTEGLGLVTFLSELPEIDMQRAIELIGDETDHLVIAELMSQLCSFVAPPEVIPCLRGEKLVKLRTSEVAVVSSASQLSDFVRIEKPVLLVGDVVQAERLRVAWGLSADSVEFEVDASGATEAVSLEQEFNYLKLIKGQEIRGKQLVRCRRIYLSIPDAGGLNTTQVPYRLQDDVLYVVTTNDEWSEDVLRIANSELKLELSDNQIEQVLENRVNNAVRQLTQDVLSQSDEVARVGKLFTLDELTSLLPTQILKEIGDHKKDSRILSEMVLAVYGPQLLKEAKSILNRKGFSVPDRWTGNESTVKFVTELGFEHSFAGFKPDPRPEHHDVQPYVEPITLREYQKSLKDKIKHFIKNPDKSGEHRALLYLPTGAGKTMVTVQALLECLREGQFGDRPILWIAQSDELCEQAARTFEEIWSTTGREGALSLDRFWSMNDAFHANYPDEHAGQVVVATIQKLEKDSVVNGGVRYEWLRNASVVVIDEAHKAGERSYTQVLGWLGTGVGRKKVDQRPLLGLSATPGGKIKSRFGVAENYLRIEVPRDEGNLNRSDVEYLREIGVLARPKFVLLEGVDVEPVSGSGMKTSDVWLPTAVEEKLAGNMKRNQAIIESIMSLPRDHSTIVFALSVAHAQLLAALLKMNGVSAAAVSGDTPAGVRRHLISNFRKGKIQVLTNYGVLTTGFDAPKVQAVYVARPTFSPSLYLQMIGRGLRGPLHGGTEECLIVGIEDNFESFNIDSIFEKMSRWLSGESTASPFDSGSDDDDEELDIEMNTVDAD